jgi:ATP-dependent RNA helicase DDX49/DBP8
LDLTGMKTPQPSRSPTVSRQEFDTTHQPDAHYQDDQESTDDENQLNDGALLPSRKGTGGLRVASSSSIREDLSEHQRQMQVDSRTFPKRRKVASEKFVFQPSTLDKLVVGIWEQVRKPSTPYRKRSVNLTVGANL